MALQNSLTGDSDIFLKEACIQTFNESKGWPVTTTANPAIDPDTKSLQILVILLLKSLLIVVIFF